MSFNEFFEDQIIEDHATQSNPTASHSIPDPFGGESSMDQFTKGTGQGRKAKRQVVGSPTEEAQKLLQEHPKPFWQIAPDGETIERTYDKDEEPIIP
jgi:hypothetical protein